MRDWRQGAVVYQIYPRSFMDANGDGIGDLQGIIQRLDYLKGKKDSLGIDAIWLSPFYPSPMADFGYDVADYCGVHPDFGSLDDFKALLAECQRRRIKVIIDLVPNHSSDEHEWFIKSRQSKDNNYSDWYIWRDGRPSEDNAMLPPNNWRDALTGGPAWQWDENRQQYYLHSFHPKQPDLNWSNPAVREAMKDVMRFWLDLGVDGFRVDAVYWMGKHPLLANDSLNPKFKEGVSLNYDAVMHDNSRGWPVVYAYLSEMARVLQESQFQQKPRFMVTEAYPERHNPLAAYMNFYVGMDPEVAAPFNFEGLSLPWQSKPWRDFLDAFHHALRQYDHRCVPSYAFGNHDQPRLASRLGRDAARAAAVMLLTLPGMIFIYYGEEIGMEDEPIPLGLAKDPAAFGDPKNGIGRDPERTPMQWSADNNAGFSLSEKTWLPVSKNYTKYNVEIENEDNSSFLWLYRRLLSVRQGNDTILSGELEVINSDEKDVLCYLRYTKDTYDRYLVVVNFSSEKRICNLGLNLSNLIVSSNAKAKASWNTEGQVTLAPYEAALFEVATLGI
jgi:alpha-glucosidase